MPDYKLPEEVTAPRRNWTFLHLLEAGAKPDTFGERIAIALGRWNGYPILGMRYNGNKDKPLGTPQSRGLATWFIVPRRLEEGVIKTLSADNQRLVTMVLATRK